MLLFRASGWHLPDGLRNRPVLQTLFAHGFSYSPPQPISGLVVVVLLVDSVVEDVVVERVVDVVLEVVVVVKVVLGGASGAAGALVWRLARAATTTAAATAARTIRTNATASAGIISALGLPGGFESITSSLLTD